MPRMGRSQEMRSPKYTRYDLPCPSCESGYVYKQNNKQLFHIFNWFKLHILFAKSFQQAICLLCFQNVLSKWYLWYRPSILSRTTTDCLCVCNLRTQMLWNPVLLSILDQIITYNKASNFQWSYLKWIPRMGRSQEMRSPKCTRYDLPCASCQSGYVYKQKNKQWIHIFHWLTLHILFAKSFQQAICLLCFQNV